MAREIMARIMRKRRKIRATTKNYTAQNPLKPPATQVMK